MNNQPNRRPNPRPERLTVAEVDLLLEAAGSTRDRALVQLAVATGARAGELATLCWGDVDLDRRAVRLVESKRARHVRISSLDTRTVAALKALRSEQESHPHKASEAATDQIFLTRAGKPMSGRVVLGRLARQASRACGRAVSPHHIRTWALRHQRRGR
jgi:integrase/recombinase XerD